MMNKLISTVSPHFHTPRSTQMIMLDVIIALVPAEIASAIIFGWRALLIVAVCVGTCVLSEFLFESRSSSLRSSARERTPFPTSRRS